MYLKGLKKSHKISRLLQVIIAVALIAGLVQLWHSSLLQGQLLLKTQTEKMGRLLVQQTAYGAAPALLLQNDQQLQWLTTALVADPKVMSATIYGEQGARLSFAQRVGAGELDPEAEETKALLAMYPPFVEPVTQDDKNLGYVEVRLDLKQFLAEIEQAHKVNMDQQQIMLLIAGLIGLLLSRSLSFKRAHFDRRKYRAKRIKAALQQSSDSVDANKADAQAADANTADAQAADVNTVSAVSANDAAVQVNSAPISDAAQLNNAPTTDAANTASTVDVATPLKPESNTEQEPESSTEQAPLNTSKAHT